MQIERVADEAALARASADRIAARIAEKPDSILILPAGRTPIATYRELVRRVVETKELDLRRAHVFQLDEILGVGPADQRSFHSLLRRQLLDHLDGRDPALDHLLDGTALDPVAEIEGHAAALKERGGADLCMLGLGLNAHVGYNEPGSERDSRARIVELDVVTLDGIRDDFRNDTVPTRGITLGLEEILASTEVLLQVSGASKRAVLRSVLEGGAGADRPASLLLDHPDLTILLDSEADPESERLARSSAPRSRQERG